MKDCSRPLEQLARCYHTIQYNIKHIICAQNTFASLHDNRDPNCPHPILYYNRPTEDFKRFINMFLLPNHQSPYVLKCEIPPQMPKCQSRDTTTMSLLMKFHHLQQTPRSLRYP